MTERERVEEVRLFFRFKKKEFAELLGHAYPQNYSNYLNGKSNLSIKMLKSIKEYNSNISTDWILYGQGQMLIKSNTNNIQSITNKEGTINQVSNTGNNTSVSNTSEVLKVKLEHLIRENEHLRQSLEDKEEIIRLLKR
ncbi:helix-turn-helix transcriptional regulator [Aureispira sp. CCB-QB1]|uniref:helix-turn-helix transcriptional regulator n=1 Tax=Aureispira sp. CCB-QB1 TaxID=1313421 RepID=UPI00069846A8|nr:helix-turn-helix transcriptional regulator [Aureispira sp. CCB-QB1]